MDADRGLHMGIGNSVQCVLTCAGDSSDKAKNTWSHQSRRNGWVFARYGPIVGVIVPSVGALTPGIRELREVLSWG